MRRAIIAVLAALAAVLLAAWPAAAAPPSHATAPGVVAAGTLVPESSGGAGDEARKAARTFRGGDPVYVSPQADAKIKMSDAGRIRKAIASHPDTSMYVAVLSKMPAKKGGAALQAIKDAVDKPGVYVLVSGAVWGYLVHGGELPTTAAKPLSSYVHHHQPTPAHMVTFIHKVQHTGSDRAGMTSGSQRKGGIPAGGIAGIIALVLILVGFVAFVLVRDRQRSKHTLADPPESSGWR